MYICLPQKQHMLSVMSYLSPPGSNTCMWFLGLTRSCCLLLLPARTHPLFESVSPIGISCLFVLASATHLSIACYVLFSVSSIDPFVKESRIGLSEQYLTSVSNRIAALLRQSAQKQLTESSAELRHEFCAHNAQQGNLKGCEPTGF